MTCCPLCGHAVHDLPLTILPSRNMVVSDAGVAVLTGCEMAVLLALDAARRRVVTKDHLHDAVYGAAPGGGPESRTIEVFVSKLRRKLRGMGLVIATHHGGGYSLGPGPAPAILREEVA